MEMVDWLIGEWGDVRMGGWWGVNEDVQWARTQKYEQNFKSK